MQLKHSKKISWISVLLLLQKTPYLPWAKNVVLCFAGLAEKAWTWKIIIPTTVSTSSWHALSGATTYVTSSESNPASGTEGDNFSFSFYNHGYKAYSYKIENLPNGLVYNNSITGPKITGTLPSQGNYSINITGYRYSGQSGNSTPTYTLQLNVSEKETEKVELSDSNSTTTSSNDTSQINQNTSVNSSNEQDSSDQTDNLESLWSDSNTTILGSGWYKSSWFGDFFNNLGGWTYHLFHGWIYIHGNDESQLWVYDDNLGWLYTGKNLYPRLYRHSTSSWLYDQSNATERKFWDYSNSTSIQINRN